MSRTAALRNPFRLSRIHILMAAAASAVAAAFVPAPAAAADGVCAAHYTSFFPAEANSFDATGRFTSYSTRPALGGQAYHIGTWDAEGPQPSFPYLLPSGYSIPISAVNVHTFTSKKAFPTAYRGNFTSQSKASAWRIPAGENSAYWTMHLRKANQSSGTPPYRNADQLGALRSYSQADIDLGIAPGFWAQSVMPRNGQGYHLTLPVQPDPQQHAVRYVIQQAHPQFLTRFDYTQSPDVNVSDAQVLADARANRETLTDATVERLMGYADSGRVERNYLDLKDGVTVLNHSNAFTGGNWWMVDNGRIPYECGLFAEIVKHPRLDSVYMLKYFIKTASISGLAPFQTRNDQATFIAYAPYVLGPTYVAPTLNPDNARTDMLTPVTVDVLSNDVRGTGTLSVVSVSQPAFGRAQVSNNRIVFTPVEQDEQIGTFVVSYTVDDGTARFTSTLTVTVTVPANQAPTFVDDIVRTNHRTPIVFNVLVNDVDDDNGPQPLRVTSVSQPARGSVTWTPDGTVWYVPVPGYVGDIVMTYRGTDGEATGGATIRISSEVCYDTVWRGGSLDCSFDDRNGSADFGGQCRQIPGGYHQVEVPCP